MKLVVLDPHGQEVIQAQLTSSAQHRDILLNEDCHINFGCQNGNCGACLFKTDNPEAFREPTAREARTLASVNSRPNERLACISKVRFELSGTVRIWNAFSVYNPTKR